MSTPLWTEKYRPRTLDDYVFKNDALKQKMEEWISTGDIPHIGFFGPAGTGKTSAIGVLLNGLEANGHIDMGDVTILNMSSEGMDAIREKIENTAQLSCFGRYRIFVLEEFETTSHRSQGSMKRIMEDYHETSRFIITSNEPHKILKPIISRLQVIKIEKHDMDQFMTRVLDVLIKEGVELETEESINTVQEYIKSSYPDFRKTLNVLQQNVVDGKLLHMEDSVESSASYRTAIVDALQNGSIRTMRELIVQSVPEDEMDAFFSYLYRNAEMFSTDEVTLMKIKVKIRDAVVKQATVSDREMNLSALLCEIDLICSGNM